MSEKEAKTCQEYYGNSFKRDDFSGHRNTNKLSPSQKETESCLFLFWNSKLMMEKAATTFLNAKLYSKVLLFRESESKVMRVEFVECGIVEILWRFVKLCKF